MGSIDGMNGSLEYMWPVQIQQYGLETTVAAVATAAAAEAATTSSSNMGSKNIRQLSFSY